MVLFYTQSFLDCPPFKKLKYEDLVLNGSWISNTIKQILGRMHIMQLNATQFEFFVGNLLKNRIICFYNFL